jgi:putative DNA primase/helicase
MIYYHVKNPSHFFTYRHIACRLIKVAVVRGVGVPENYELLKIEDFAIALRVKPSCIRRWILESRITIVKIGRLVRIPSCEIDRIVQRGLQPCKRQDHISKREEILAMTKYGRTDAGNAEFFAAVNKEELRYDHKRGQWLAWHKHWWTKDNNGLVYRLAKSVARMRAQAAQHMSEKEKEKEIAWARLSESWARLEAMLKLAESEYPLSDSGEGWDAAPMLLGVANGVVDLKTGVRRDGLPAEKITLWSPFEFDASAPCPRWLRFLNEVFGNDQSLINFVQRAAGYSLTGSTREQCLFLLYGSGANGKSTFLEVLRKVFGCYASNLPFSALELASRSNIPNDVAGMAGKRLVTAIETSESAQLNEARIKMLTGGDPVTARHLYGEFFVFLPTAKLWLAFNHLPNVKDDSPGFWRRIKLIPFNQRFESGAIDKELLPKLAVESPGILAWAVQGALMWQTEGLGEPTVVREATETYRKVSDPLEEFIEEYCIVTPSARVTAAAIWNAFDGWQDKTRGHIPLNRTAFSQRLEAKGFRKERHGHLRTRIWCGIDLKYITDGLLRDEHEGVRTDADANSPIVSS